MVVVVCHCLVILILSNACMTDRDPIEREEREEEREQAVFQTWRLVTGQRKEVGSVVCG